MTPSTSPIIDAIVSQGPAVAATFAIVWAFLRHLSDESKRHLESRERSDQLFTSALAEIRQDVRTQSEAARVADIKVAEAVGELTARVVELHRLQDRITASAVRIEEIIEENPKA